MAPIVGAGVGGARVRSPKLGLTDLRLGVESGITPWRRPLGDEPTEARAMASYELVERVDERSSANGSQNEAERASHRDFGKERHAPSAVSGNWCAIAEDEPPTLVARFLGDGREQPVGLLIGERKQGELFASVESDDDPRRPAAEPSAAGIEQNRAR